MVNKQDYEINYDAEADFLEIFFGKPTKCYAEETERGVFIRKDERTNEVKSISILNFKKRTISLQKILHKCNKSIPLELVYK